MGNITDIWNAFEHPIEIKGLSEYLYFICFSSRTLQKLYYKILLNDMEIQQILRLPEDQKNTQGLQLPPQFTYKDRKIGQLHRDVQQVGSILNQIDIDLTKKVLKFIENNELNKVTTSHDSTQYAQLKRVVNLWKSIFNGSKLIDVEISIPSELHDFISL